MNGVFTETEVVEVKRILQNFKAIVQRMGFDVSTSVTVNNDKTEMEVDYICEHGRKFGYYIASNYQTWKDFVIEVKSNLFGELTSLAERGD